MTDPIVELKSGLVRGVIEKHEDGFDYYFFKGIPYAEPPVGELRFEDPLPIKQWTGIIDCKNYGPKSFQYDFFMKIANHNEDSLYLNVFTHSINEADVNIPVVMVIHGGGLMFGSSDDFFYGAEYLIRKNIVIVTFNYRLGVMGFLNLEDEVAPGNQGLKDQLMVLKWIQQNIRSFGGDPDNVTVFGVSAGAIAAHYMTQSPLTKGLFNKVIMQGCSIYNPWIHTPKKSNAIKLCSLLGKDLTDSGEIKKFLKSVDAKELEKAQTRLIAETNRMPFSPGTDEKSPNPFIPIDEYVAADQGIHIPCIVGYTSREGLVLTSDETKEEFLKCCNLNFESIFQFNTKAVADHYNITTNQVRRLYYKNEIVSKENLDNYIDFTSDFYFVDAIHRLARVQAEKSSAPTYLFQFSYDQPNSLSKMFLGHNFPGASHLDDVPYVFKVHAFDDFGGEYYKKGTRQYKLMDQMTEMWANFIKYGNPTIEISELTPVHWLPSDDGTVLRHLNLDEDITMQYVLNVDQKLLSARNIKD